MFMTLLAVFEKSGNILLELLPYIVLGILLAGVLKYTPMISSLFGVLSPLCTYGTIPIVIQLYREWIWGHVFDK